MQFLQKMHATLFKYFFFLLVLPCFSITVDHRHHVLLLTVPTKSKDKSFDFAQEPRTVFGLFICSLTGGGEREMCRLVALTGWSLLGFLLYWSVLIILKYALWRISFLLDRIKLNLHNIQQTAMLHLALRKVSKNGIEEENRKERSIKTAKYKCWSGDLF